jgi:ferredoxin
VKLVIDDDRCTGHARCVVLQPSLFTDDERGYGLVKDDVSLDDDAKMEAAGKAVAACPEQAISIVE